MKHFVLRGLGLVCCLVLTTSCVEPEYGHLEMTQLTNPPSGSAGAKVSVTSSRIELPVGLAVFIQALPISGNDQPYTAQDSLNLVSSNTDVFGVFYTGRRSRVVITGAHVGDACLGIQVNGSEVECVPVRVTPQP